MSRRPSPARIPLAGALLACLLVVPIALAADGAGSAPSQRAGVEKKLKGLKKQVKAQKRRLAALEAKVANDEGAPRPPSGPAGGGLTGTYPNPSLAAEAEFTKLSIDGPCPGGHSGACPGAWDSSELTLTRKDGPPSSPITYESFLNGAALGFSGTNGDSMFISGTGFMTMKESSLGPSVLPPPNGVAIFARDSGGATELVAVFSDGDTVVLAGQTL